MKQHIDDNIQKCRASQ